jgi:hypothetical protein
LESVCRLIATLLQHLLLRPVLRPLLRPLLLRQRLSLLLRRAMWMQPRLLQHLLRPRCMDGVGVGATVRGALSLLLMLLVPLSKQSLQPVLYRLLIWRQNVLMAAALSPWQPHPAHRQPRWLLALLTLTLLLVLVLLLLLLMLPLLQIQHQFLQPAPQQWCTLPWRADHQLLLLLLLLLLEGGRPMAAQQHKKHPLHQHHHQQQRQR